LLKNIVTTVYIKGSMITVVSNRNEQISHFVFQKYIQEVSLLGTCIFLEGYFVLIFHREIYMNTQTIFYTGDIICHKMVVMQH